MDSLEFISHWGWQARPELGSGGGENNSAQASAFNQLNDRLSAAYADLMYAALAFNINVEHQPGPRQLQQHQQLSPRAFSEAFHGSPLPSCGPSGQKSLVRDLVVSLVQQEWRERSLSGSTSAAADTSNGTNSGSNSGSSSAGLPSCAQGSSASWLMPLSSSDRERVGLALAAQGHGVGLDELVRESVARASASADLHFPATDFIPSAQLAAQLLAVLPSCSPIPASSLAHAQEPDLPWPTADPVAITSSSSGRYDLEGLLQHLLAIPVGSVFCSRYTCRGLPIMSPLDDTLTLPARQNGMDVLVRFFNSAAAFESARAGTSHLEVITGLPGLPPALVLLQM